MTNLNEILKESLNETAKIIDENNSIILVSFEKGNALEFATFKYNDKGLYAGHYFTTKYSDAATAKGDALRDFSIRTMANK